MTYGNVKDDELQDTADKLKEKIFDIASPLVVSYNEVEDLRALSIAAQNEYIERQLVKIGVQLIKNMNDFERALENWISSTRAYHTRVNFKLHSETAHEVLRRMRGPTLKIQYSLTQQTPSSTVLERS